APDTPVTNSQDSPWTLLGPVLPGDTPAPLPTLPAGSYPQWDNETVYVAGDRVQLGLVPYEAKWWTQGSEPGVAIVGGTPWVLIMPTN
ncbi:MAG: glycosyl hydrolase family 18, partial [Demequinaceae bacterium]|nr:glycosyl hydrolase family 18 [Demequinaceae bacterium]